MWTSLRCQREIIGRSKSINAERAQEVMYNDET